MKYIVDYSRSDLAELQAQLLEEYRKYQALNLKLDMSRGKPSGEQLDLTNGALAALDTYHTAAGVDARNYGGLEGIPEMRELFADLLGVPADQMIIGGNSSLNLMYDAVARCMIFGTLGSTPWCKLPKVKFLCPSPGYDRHFAICADFGIEMIPVPMTSDGPDMDMVEELAAADDAVKGIWCVPLYSNPQGICYSDRTVERLAAMKTATADFRIFWDNAYGVHHIYGERSVKDILAETAAAGNPDRVYYFFSTSKITFPGAGVAMVAASAANIAEIKRRMSVQTIGHDKLNQLRTLRFLGNADGVRQHMAKLADSLRPKFDMVLQTLERELGGSGLATWEKPAGGYFVAVDTLDGCAKRVVQLAREAGVVMTGAGATFPYGKDPRDRNIRIAPSYPTPAELKPAIEIFCICVKLAGVEKLLAE